MLFSMRHSYSGAGERITTVLQNLFNDSSDEAKILACKKNCLKPLSNIFISRYLV